MSQVLTISEPISEPTDPASAPPTAERRAPRRPTGWRAFLELGKPRLSLMAIVAVIAGFAVGLRGEPLPTVATWVTAVGTMLCAMGGSALNMFREREFDARMKRTQDRPLPSGRLSPRQVLTFGLGCCALGLVLLAMWSNLLATVLCATIVITYVMVYTPLKQKTTLNTLVGAIPGALPPVVGFAAATNYIDQRAVALFLILFFWQIPHFLAIAWRHRDDYAAGGMQMLPTVDPEGRITGIYMIIYTLALIATTAIAHVFGLSGRLYFIASLFLGVFFLVPVVIAAIRRTDTTMYAAFIASLLYLPALLGVMVLDLGNTWR